MLITKEMLVQTAIIDDLDSLANLRLEIFREYPYLYDGRKEDELDYLKSYAEAPDACLILACDAGTFTCKHHLTGLEYPFCH